MNPAPPARVSVMMITYRQERFLAQAIESVLAQRTSFPIELVIGEDCSPDGTRAIVERYAAARPDIVRPLLHPRNVGANANAAATTAACRGEFVAMLEGDDFWTFPHKLQRQVEWLEAHPDAPLCFHDVAIVREDGAVERPRYCQPRPPERVSIEALLERNPVPTCSVLYRRAAIPPLPAGTRGLPMQDWPSWVLAAQHGAIGYIDEVWAAYRLHGGGTWSMQTNERQLRHVVQFYDAMQPVLGRDHAARISRLRKDVLANLIDMLVSQGRWRDARRLAWRYLLESPRRFRAPPRRRALYYRIALGLPSGFMRAPTAAP